MRWKINQYIFCDQQLTLKNNENTQQLEPMVGELLSFFCAHPSEILSRDELIDQVWLGRVVSDNAVNRVITKLRKNFNDNAKQPQFIATFPKKGYKFIAVISQVELPEKASVIEEENTASTNNQFPSSPLHESEKLLAVEPKAKKVLIISVCLALVLLMFSVLMMKLMSDVEEGKITYPITQLKPLTREAGKERQPQLSPDQQYLGYTEGTPGKISLWIKSLTDQQKIEITHGDDTWVGPLSWNNAGDKIAYLVTTDSSCQYFIRSFNQLALGEAKLIHNCPAGSFGKIIFTHDDDVLVYSEASARGEPFEMFKLQLSTSEKTRLNQPTLVLGGNSQYDLHPSENKLLISSPDKQQWEGFYSLNLENDQLNLLFKQNAYICCGIWDHSGTRVVLMGEHPSQQLVSFDLKGKDPQIIYSGNQQVSAPERHANGRDYLFPSGIRNQNLSIVNAQNQEQTPVGQSSVDERLARFVKDGKKIVYIGLESGNEELWQYNLASKQRRQLSQFKGSRRFYDLLPSDDGQYIAALQLNQIDLLEVATGQARSLKIPQVDIRGLSFVDDERLAFSLKSKTGWRVHHYNIKTDKLTALDEKWHFIQFSENVDDNVWQDAQGKRYIGADQQPLTLSVINEVDLLAHRHFNLRKNGDIWLWQIYENNQYQLIQYDQTSGEKTIIATNDSDHFDWHNQQVITSDVEYANSDIYQTVALDK